MSEAVADCELDLTGRAVITEAATGSYAVTPVLAALAGAREVVAVARGTRHGTFDEVCSATAELAELAGVSDRIVVVDRLSPEHLASADVVTNSGHVRPIDASVIELMKPDAVVPLMYEAWELDARSSDVDVVELRRRGIRVAGTNERHPNVDVFSYLGPLAVGELFEAGISVYRAEVAVLCDNDFGPYLHDGLKRVGASVTRASNVAELEAAGARFDAIVVALTPRADPVLTASDATVIAARWPDCVLVQYWGDVDRGAFAARDVEVWPSNAPAAGHMAVLLADIGPEAVVRLQCGGLKVAEVLLRPDEELTEAERAYVDEL